MSPEERDKILLNFFNKGGIVCSDIIQLDGMQIPREIFLNMDRYNALRDSIPELKNLFSSSHLTSLHASAVDKQKWPLLNLVRQIILSSGYNLEPKRLSNGYSATGVKKYKRVFIVKKFNVEKS